MLISAIDSRVAADDDDGIRGPLGACTWCLVRDSFLPTDVAHPRMAISDLEIIRWILCPECEGQCEPHAFADHFAPDKDHTRLLAVCATSTTPRSCA